MKSGYVYRPKVSLESAVRAFGCQQGPDSALHIHGTWSYPLLPANDTFDACV